MTKEGRFTICVLFYEDHPELAQRCLGSLIEKAPAALAGLRVGLNAVPPEALARKMVRELVAAGRMSADNCWDAEPANCHKYPAMRAMFYDKPITTPYIMWLDDDSFVRSEAGGDWLDQIAERMERHDKPAVLGGVYGQRLIGDQARWVRSQPWFTGVPVSKRMPFVTGGWWCARRDFLAKHDYPWPALDHRGGDVLLGALCQQQRASLANFRASVAINADGMGRESASPRRGFDQAPLGSRFAPDLLEGVSICK